MTRFLPLDVRCPPDEGGCGAAPGQRCAVIDAVTGLPTNKRRSHPHPARRRVAADANRAGRQ